MVLKTRMFLSLIKRKINARAFFFTPTDSCSYSVISGCRDCPSNLARSKIINSASYIPGGLAYYGILSGWTNSGN